MQQRYGRTPAAVLADGGYVALEDIRAVGQRAEGCRVYAPPPAAPTRAGRPLWRADDATIAEWRQRMCTPEAAQIYKERAATIECVNALARNRGLQRFLVRGWSACGPSCCGWPSRTICCARSRCRGSTRRRAENRSDSTPIDRRTPRDCPAARPWLGAIGQAPTTGVGDLNLSPVSRAGHRLSAHGRFLHNLEAGARTAVAPLRSPPSPRGSPGPGTPSCRPCTRPSPTRRASF